MSRNFFSAQNVLGQWQKEFVSMTLSINGLYPCSASIDRKSQDAMSAKTYFSGHCFRLRNALEYCFNATEKISQKVLHQKRFSGHHTLAKCHRIMLIFDNVRHWYYVTCNNNIYLSNTAN